uniref:bifunctional protein GlmU-like n=1 Tax=Styela clava TaxID=7725 RepID=UPI001939BE77|nr:bifunctional protein GlmU-like [Styela clava]
MSDTGDRKSSCGSSLTCHALRLRPGQNITDEIVRCVKENELKAAFILTCCGSVTKATIRMANASSTNTNEIKTLDGRHEITSLVGTVCNSGDFHLHVTLGDVAGNAIAGHVMGDMEVFTTAEIVLGECNGLSFTREFDKETAFDELVIGKRN